MCGMNYEIIADTKLIFRVALAVQPYPPINNLCLSVIPSFPPQLCSRGAEGYVILGGGSKTYKLLF